MKDITRDLRGLVKWLTEAESECLDNAQVAWGKISDAHKPGSNDEEHGEPYRLKGMADGIRLSRARLLAVLKVASEE